MSFADEPLFMPIFADLHLFHQLRPFHQLHPFANDTHFAKYPNVIGKVGINGVLDDIGVIGEPGLNWQKLVEITVHWIVLSVENPWVINWPLTHL